MTTQINLHCVFTISMLITYCTRWSVYCGGIDYTLFNSVAKYHNRLI